MIRINIPNERLIAADDLFIDILTMQMTRILCLVNTCCHTRFILSCKIKASQMSRQFRSVKFTSRINIEIIIRIQREKLDSPKRSCRKRFNAIWLVNEKWTFAISCFNVYVQELPIIIFYYEHITKQNPKCQRNGICLFEIYSRFTSSQSKYNISMRNSISCRWNVYFRILFIYGIVYFFSLLLLSSAVADEKKRREKKKCAQIFLLRLCDWSVGLELGWEIIFHAFDGWMMKHLWCTALLRRVYTAIKARTLTTFSLIN